MFLQLVIAYRCSYIWLYIDGHVINIVGYTVKISKMLFMSPISLFICDCEHRLLQKSSMYDQTYKQRMLIKQLFILLKWTTIWTSFYLLYHYPRSKCVIFDNGREFKLHFKSLCRSFGFKQKPTTELNPQANAIRERIHAVLGDMLRSSQYI